MGLISSLFGNASEIDIVKVQKDLSPVLVPGETIGKGFKIFRDMFIFTDHRLIMIDKQGLTGSKTTIVSIQPPAGFGKEIWEELADKGYLTRDGIGFFSLVPGK